MLKNMWVFVNNIINGLISIPVENCMNIKFIYRASGLKAVQYLFRHQVLDEIILHVLHVWLIKRLARMALLSFLIVFSRRFKDL